MKKVYICCHSVSEKFIKRTLDALRDDIAYGAGFAPEVLIVDQVDNHLFEAGSVVFIVGDYIPEFTKRSDCYYVFINFSIVEFMRLRKIFNSGARNWISKKKKAFSRKVDFYPMIVDFYRPQSRILAPKYKNNCRILGFLPTIATETEPDIQKIYDVCVVGSGTPRRKRVYEKLKDLGAVLSPLESNDLDQVIKQSRFVLNVHAYDCDTAELPRILHALKSGVPLISEPCYEIDELIPKKCYAKAKFGDIAQIYKSLDAAYAKAQAMANKGLEHLNTVYEPRAKKQWASIFDSIKKEMKGSL